MCWSFVIQHKIMNASTTLRVGIKRTVHRTTSWCALITIVGVWATITSWIRINMIIWAGSWYIICTLLLNVEEIFKGGFNGQIWTSNNLWKSLICWLRAYLLHKVKYYERVHFTCALRWTAGSLTLIAKLVVVNIVMKYCQLKRIWSCYGSKSGVNSVSTTFALKNLTVINRTPRIICVAKEIIPLIGWSCSCLKGYHVITIPVCCPWQWSQCILRNLPVIIGDLKGRFYCSLWIYALVRAFVTKRVSIS